MGGRGRVPIGAGAIALIAPLLALGAWALVPAAASAQVPGLPPVPILGNPLANSPKFQGAPASPNPIGGIAEPPRHPFMAPNERSNIHNDAYQTDVYHRAPGPLGDGPEVSTLFARECGSVAFDSQGRIVTVCVGLDRPVLALLDPHSLATLAALPLPPRNLSSGANPFNDFSGGGYFYLDNRDRAVVATTDRRVIVAAASGSSFAIERTYNLAGAVAQNDGIISVLPDWSGRLWFVTRRGVVGTINPGSGDVDSLTLRGEGISNSFAVDDEGGVYVVSDAALYRLDAGQGGAPVVTWRQPYPDSNVHKPSQSDAGSGTTPTVMGRGWVAITDNADPMNVRVYRRAIRVKPTKAQKRKALKRAKTKKAKRRLKRRWRSRTREICAEPVFERGAGATDQSLIVAGNSIITENNYGYSGIAAVELGGTTTPGITRVDVVSVRSKGKRRGRKRGGGWRRRGKGKVRRHECRTVWTSSERAPSVVPKLSLATGLVYTYTKPAGTGIQDPWYFTALDFRTGATVYRRLAGEGLGYNNNYAPVTLGPDGTAYVGVLGGLAAFR